MKSNSARLISETNDAPIDLDAVTEAAPIIRREESDDEDATVALAAIPAIDGAAPSHGTRRSKRARSNTDIGAGAGAGAGADAGHVIGDQDTLSDAISDEDDAREDDDGLFVESPTTESPRPPPAKRRRPAQAADEDEEDDKKKLAMDISYEGFSIYGRVLCLVVKRRDGSGADPAERGTNASTTATAAAAGSGSNRSSRANGRGQTMMENFIMSTQIPAGTDVP